jgi:hypothetical protein
MSGYATAANVLIDRDGALFGLACVQDADAQSSMVGIRSSSFESLRRQFAF